MKGLAAVVVGLALISTSWAQGGPAKEDRNLKAMQTVEGTRFVTRN
jgi:hypothetical protein